MVKKVIHRPWAQKPRLFDVESCLPCYAHGTEKSRMLGDYVAIQMAEVGKGIKSKQIQYIAIAA
jgi:hypothetical protein